MTTTTTMILCYASQRAHALEEEEKTVLNDTKGGGRGKRERNFHLVVARLTRVDLTPARRERLPESIERVTRRRANETLAKLRRRGDDNKEEKGRPKGERKIDGERRTPLINTLNVGGTKDTRETWQGLKRVTRRTSAMVQGNRKGRGEREREDGIGEQARGKERKSRKRVE